MVIKSLLIIVIIAILMDDSSSIRKTGEEKREEKELAELVNKTLAEEKKKEDEEKKKKMTDRVKDGEREDETERTTVEKQEGQDEACPPANYTCPIVEPCPEVKDCPPQRECKSCAPCPTVECGPCPTVKPCQPCPPNPVVNHTEETGPTVCQCPERSEGMTVPAAMAVGAVATVLLTGVAASLGLLLRYASPIVSGFVFLATIIVVWYLCSHHPETARELGGRAATLLREAATALGHRIMEALRHHNNQVGFS
jgi:hypothetical protein